MKNILMTGLIITSLQQAIGQELNLPFPPLPISVSVLEEDPIVVIDPDGNMVAIWSESGMVKVSDLAPNGNWSMPVTLSQPQSTATSPTLEVNAEGTATAIWLENNSIRAAVRPKGKEWSEPVLSPALLADADQLILDAEGHPIAVQNRKDGPPADYPKLAIGFIDPALNGPQNAPFPLHGRTDGEEYLHPKGRRSRIGTYAPLFRTPGLEVGSTNAIDAPTGGALSGIQVGFAAGTAAPTNGAVIAGQVGIATTSLTGKTLTIGTIATDYYAISARPTITVTDSGIATGGQRGLDLAPTFNPTSPAANSSCLAATIAGIFGPQVGGTLTTAASLYLSGTFTGNAATITNFYGVYFDGGGSTVGTITNTYGGYFTLPVAGTNQHALHADNTSIGSSYTGSSTPPTNGAIIQGNVGIGNTSPAEKLDVSGGIRSLAALTGTPSASLALDYGSTSSVGRILAFGVNNATNGILRFLSLRSDASNAVTMMSVDSNGVAIGGTYAVSGTPPANGAIIQGKVYLNQSSIAANLTSSPLSISTGSAQATPGVGYGMIINSNDASNSLELSFGLYGSATAGLRGGFIEATVPGTSYNPLYIQPDGGGIAVGYTNTVAPPNNGAIIQGTVGIGLTSGFTDKLNINDVSPATFSGLGLFNSGTVKWTIRELFSDDSFRIGDSGAYRFIMAQTTGNIGLGITPTAQIQLYLNHALTGTTGSLTGLQIQSAFGASSGTVGDAECIYLAPTFSNNVTTITTAAGLIVAGGTAGGSITTGYGILVNSLAFGTTRYGISVSIPSGGTNNYTAYFDAGVGIGTNPLGASLTVSSPSLSFGISLFGTYTSVGFINSGTTSVTSAATNPIGISNQNTITTSAASTVGYGIYDQPTWAATGAGTFSNATAMYIFNSLGTTTIGTAFGLRIDTGSASATGTSNHYALFVQRPSGGTNRYTAYFDPVVGIGDTPIGGAALRVSAGNIDAGIYIDGTQTQNGNLGYTAALSAVATLRPPSNGNLYGVNIQVTPDTTTSSVSNFFAFRSAPGAKTGGNALTNAYSAYITSPSGASTINIATYTDNLSVGYPTNNPTTNGAIILGYAGVGIASPVCPLDLNGSLPPGANQTCYGIHNIINSVAPGATGYNTVATIYTRLNVNAVTTTFTNYYGLFIDAVTSAGGGFFSTCWSLYVNPPGFGNNGLATFNGTGNSVIIDGVGNLYPSGNKGTATSLGLTTNRWATIWAGSNSIAACRITPSKLNCLSCGKRMMRTAGSLVLGGETADYTPVWCCNEECPHIGNVRMEFLKHFDPAKLALRTTPPKIEFKGFKVTQLSGNARQIEVIFRYIDPKMEDGKAVIGSAVEDSTIFSDQEYEDFMQLSSDQQLQYIINLGIRQWQSMEEVQILKCDCELLQTQLDSFSEKWKGKNLLEKS
jgi:hypothetical protein